MLTPQFYFIPPILHIKKRNNGIRDSFAHMSPSRGDASQGIFFEVYGNLVIRYFLYYKKSVQDGIGDSFAHMSPTRGDASQGTFFEVYGNFVLRYFLYKKQLL